MVPFAKSRRMLHALSSANTAVVEHGVGAMETVVDVALGEVEVASVTGLL